MCNQVHFFCKIAVIVSLCAACGTSLVEENVPYLILSKNELYGLNVAGRQTHAGARIILWNASDPNNPEPNDVWLFRKVDDGYKIFSRHSNLCLNVSGAWAENNASIIQWSDSGDEADNEIWQIESNNGGYSLIAKHSGKLLSVRDADVSAGAQIVQYEKDPQIADAQTWEFKKLQ